MGKKCCHMGTCFKLRRSDAAKEELDRPKEGQAVPCCFWLTRRCTEARAQARPTQVHRARACCLPPLNKALLPHASPLLQTAHPSDTSPSRGQLEYKNVDAMVQAGDPDASKGSKVGSAKVPAMESNLSSIVHYSCM